MSRLPRIAAPAPHARDTDAAKEHKTSTGGHGLFMVLCCAAMAIGLLAMIYAVPAGQSLPSILLYAAPALGCLAMHVVMHRFMGKSCHGGKSDKDTQE